MKIYFNASITGKKEYGENYQKIVDALQEMDHKVVYEHVFKTEINHLASESTKERAEHHKYVSSSLNNADLMVTEVSYPSVSVGYEIGLALDKNKPVLALYATESPPPALAGENSEKFIIAQYDPMDLKSSLQILINELVELQDTRFNFFISPKHQNYLDWIAKHRKIPRSVFLRRLIEEHMENNPDYKG